MSIGVSDKG